MAKKIKNAIIFIAIAAVLALGYVFFIKKSPLGANLVSTWGVDAGAAHVPLSADSVDKDFLPLLLSVKNIRLNDSIFSDPAFMSLTDSSIVLIPDMNEGRPNPFAPLSPANPVSSPAKPKTN